VASGQFNRAALTDALIDGINTSLTKRREVVRLLLEHGANPNGRSNGWMPLESAIQNNDLGSIHLLLDHGANVNGQITGYGTALDAALMLNKPEAALVLLERGADPKRSASGGTTSTLTQALQLGNDTLVRKLLEKGANANE